MARMWKSKRQVTAHAMLIARGRLALQDVAQKNSVKIGGGKQCSSLGQTWSASSLITLYSLQTPGLALEASIPFILVANDSLNRCCVEVVSLGGQKLSLRRVSTHNHER
jgi:hypothetical protein